MLKLRRERSRTDKKSGKTYEKWRLTPPEATIKALGWGDGDELEPSVEGNALVIRRAEDGKKP